MATSLRPRTPIDPPSPSGSGWATATTIRTRAACPSIRRRRSGRPSSRRSARPYRIAKFAPPAGLQTAKVDAFTGLKPGPFTKKTVEELFIKGTVPSERESIRVALDVDAASGLLWQDGCVGPRVSRGFFDLSEVESNFPAWQKANRLWAARAAKGSGVRGGPEGTRTTYFYNGAFAPYGRSWGAPFAPRERCPLAPPPSEEPVCDPLALEPCIPPAPTPKETKPPKP